MFSKTNAVLTLAALTASALVASPGGAAPGGAAPAPLNVTFHNTDGTFGIAGGFTDPDGLPSADGSGLGFTGDALSLDFAPGLLGSESFTGTDLLTAAGGTLDLSLAGTIVPVGGGSGGEEADFTGLATVTGGTLGLSGTATLSGQLAPAVTTEAAPAGPAAGTPGAFMITYGDLRPSASPAVPETAPLVLLALGLLPAGMALRARRRA